MRASGNSLLEPGTFLLGTFASNCSGGMTVTKVPERWDNSFANNLRLAQLLDDAGIDFMLPIARWIGYGGDTNFHGGVLETMTWATGLLAKTRNINVFATVHTAANHPVVVAKQLATIDQISGGRIGLNIVAGWNKPEYEALGLTLPDDHETRYGYAQEWFEIVQALWSRDKRLRLGWKILQAEERARRSPAGHRLADPQCGRLGRRTPVCGAQCQLPVYAGDRPRSFKGRGRRAEGAGARQAEESIDVLTFAHVVCRPTEKEAKDYLEHFGKHPCRLGCGRQSRAAPIRPCAVLPA